MLRSCKYNYSTEYLSALCHPRREIKGTTGAETVISLVATGSPALLFEPPTSNPRPDKFPLGKR